MEPKTAINMYDDRARSLNILEKMALDAIRGAIMKAISNSTPSQLVKGIAEDTRLWQVSGSGLRGLGAQFGPRFKNLGHHLTAKNVVEWLRMEAREHEDKMARHPEGSEKHDFHKREAGRYYGIVSVLINTPPAPGEKIGKGLMWLHEQVTDVKHNLGWDR